MHLVLLGIFIRLLMIWTGDWSKKHFQHWLGIREKFQLKKKLRRIRLSYPEEFHRITITLKYPKHLKANELRAIIHYIGPVVFKGILSKYIHFCIYIWQFIFSFRLPRPKPTLTWPEIVCKLFAFQFGEIFGKNHVIYNVHSLIYLVDDCELHGPLDSCSAFSFESFLYARKISVLAEIVNEYLK
jgi:hypothetical protein